MRSNPAIALVALIVVAAACSDSESTATASTAAAPSTTTTTTLVPSTSLATSTIVTSTTTEPEATTTTVGVETTTTTTTTAPAVEPDPDLVPWAGLFRQPTAFNGFLDFQSNGVIRAGTSIDALDITGRWDYNAEAAEFIFTDFDFGAGCNGAAGRYARENAAGGGRRVILIEDPCQNRIDFITQPGSTCSCFLYNRVELAEG